MNLDFFPLKKNKINKNTFRERMNLKQVQPSHLCAEDQVEDSTQQKMWGILSIPRMTPILISRRRARKYEAYDFENVLPTAKPPPGTQSFWEAYQEQGNLYFGDFLQGGHLQEYFKI